MADTEGENTGARSLRTRDDALPAAVRQLMDTALTWLAAHPGSTSAELGNGIGCPQHKAALILQAAEYAGDAHQLKTGRRWERGPGAAPALPSPPGTPRPPPRTPRPVRPPKTPRPPVPSRAARTGTCPVCGRAIGITKSGRLRLHRPGAEQKSRCPGSGTAAGPAAGRAYTTPELRADCRRHGISADTAERILLAVAGALQEMGGTR